MVRAKLAVLGTCLVLLITGLAGGVPAGTGGRHERHTVGVPLSPSCGITADAGEWELPGVAANIQFQGSRQGWVVMANEVLHTSDGGRHWLVQYRHGADLQQVDFVSTDDGWAIGWDEVMRTTDGGRRWQRLPEPCWTLRSVDFINRSDGFAVGGGPYLRGDTGVALPISGGRLLFTADAGEQWRLVPGAPANVTSVCFDSPVEGWAGTPQEIWKTTNGGRRWAMSFREPPHRQLPVGGVLGTPGDTPEVQCAPPHSAWALFLGYVVAMFKSNYVAFATVDGRHWRAVLEGPYEDFLMPSVHTVGGPGSYPGPFSLAGATTAVFVGDIPAYRDDGAIAVAVANRGGADVDEQGMVPGMTYADAVWFASPERGWLVGDGVIEATTNGAKTWSVEHLGTVVRGKT